MIRQGPTPHEALAAAVHDAAAAGLVIPCRTDDAPLWTSEDAGERAEAAARCIGDACPALTPCAAVGAGERWHVWAGQDRRPARPRAAATGRNGGEAA